MLALSLPCTGRAQNTSKDAYADFAMKHDGDAARGRRIFLNEQRAACVKCHSTDGSASKAGPDLASVGSKFSRRDLIRSVLEPSAAIAIGYATTIVETKDGAEQEGIVKQLTESRIELMGADGRIVRIARSDMTGQRTGDRSLMPEGLEAGMSPSEFADLIAYLGSLRQATQKLTAANGMPEKIPLATKGTSFEPLFQTNIHLKHPVWFGPAPGAENAFVALEQNGRIWRLERAAGGDTQTSLLDLSKTVLRQGDATGLLGMAFHPQFAQNRKYYLKYQTKEAAQIETLLVERKFAADGRADSGEPARTLMKIPGVTDAHNGGCLAFGPDGFLYIGMGDTGPQRDPQGHGQDLGVWQGKMLRIDVDHAEDGLPYAIPRDNPFRHRKGARPEIWAYGFREPWRFSFDSLTHDLWYGDVGQDRIEEVGIVRAGENQGWNVFEGFEPFSDQYRRQGEKYVPPVFAYPHRVGVSITGGYVYRGTRAPTMRGWYVCADFQTRRVWALTQKDRVLQRILEIGTAPDRVASFAQDEAGEIYLVGYDSGVIYRLGLEKVETTPL